MTHRSKRAIPPLFWLVGAFLGCGVLGVGGLFAYQIPTVNEALFYRVEVVKSEVRNIFYPRADTLPTAIPVSADASPIKTVPTILPSFEDAAPKATPVLETSSTAAPTATIIPTAVLEPTEISVPDSAILTGFTHEYQRFNNCGPAILSMSLSYWGWDGSQYETADWLKPDPADKNVRPDELVDFITTQTGLTTAYRAGGDLDVLKRLISKGYPVIVEKGFWVDEARGWMGHYLLLNGYDDAVQSFTTQDSFRGPDQLVSYDAMDADWQAFNRLFLVPYPPENESDVMALLGSYADQAASFEIALETAQNEVILDPANSFPWHNLGTNLNYFGDYANAAAAFDEARTVGLPWRMLWYQTGPYRAYYNAGRYFEVITLATGMLSNTPGLEESYFWRGWAQNAAGNTTAAVSDFNQALAVNENFEDARAALEYLGK